MYYKLLNINNLIYIIDILFHNKWIETNICWYQVTKTVNDMANKVMDQLVKDGLEVNDNNKDCEFIYHVLILFLYY